MASSNDEATMPLSPTEEDVALPDKDLPDEETNQGALPLIDDTVNTEMTSAEPDKDRRNGAGATNRNAAKDDSRPATAKLMKMIDVLNSSIGTKETAEKHQLNLNMLYTLLLALIEKLDMKESSIPINGIALPTTNALQHGISKEPAAVTEMWNVIQLQKQTEANRDGINKLMEITNDILAQLSALDTIKDDLAQKSNKLDQLHSDTAAAREEAKAAKIASELAIATAGQTAKDGGGGGGKKRERGRDGSAGRKSDVGNRGGKEEEDDEEEERGGSRGGGKGTRGTGSEGADFGGRRNGGSEEADDETAKGEGMLDRLEALEAQVKRLQKFRKAATFKIQDLPDDAGNLIKATSEALSLHDQKWGESGGDSDNLSKALKTLQAIPDISLTEMRGLSELLRRILAGTEWDKLKQLIAEINKEQGLAVCNEDFLIRLMNLENILGVESEADGDPLTEEKTVESDGAKAKAKIDAKAKDKNWKLVHDLRKDVNNLGELVKTILDGGGAEAAQQTFEEIKKLWLRIEKHGSDIERSFGHIGNMESKLKELLMQLNGITRLTQSLKDDKADKRWVRSELDEKTDRAELDLKLDQEKYNKDVEEVDAVIAELEAQISEAMAKFYRELNSLKFSHFSKMDKDDYTSLAKMLTDKIGHMGQMLTFVSEVFSGDKAADFLKNSIIRNNCCSCDRTIYTASQPVEPVLPSTDGFSSMRSIAPVTVLKKKEVRQAMNDNSNHIRDHRKNISNNSKHGGHSQFMRTVAQRECLRRERLARLHQSCQDPLEVGQVRTRDLRNFSNEAYYRVTGPGEFVDTYAQDPRPVGGGYTQNGLSDGGFSDIKDSNRK